MAGVGVRIRMYRVGFGDFFLLSVPAKGGGYAHVLVDCGVHAKNLGVIGQAVAQLKAETGGKLALVIMTHRHADHISGFASEKDTFKDFKVERVWMSWFEEPTNPTALKIQAGLTDAARRLTAALAARGEDNPHFNMARNILGAAGASNDTALQVLHGFKTQKGEATPVDYYRAGDAAKLPQSLIDAGLTAQILGPPTDLDLVAKMDNKAHQYLTEEGEPVQAASEPPFRRPYIDAAYAWPKGERPLFADDVVRRHIADSQPDNLAAAAQSADNAINNQSVVVLFTFAGKTMLFCGDAQWGNWANFLFGGPAGVGAAQLTASAKSILGNLDFLKVGHHGSTNATPKDVVAALKLGCCAMCSTATGAYGCEKKGTEVPRIPLLADLTIRTNRQLARSDQVPVGAIAAEPGLDALNAVFKAGPAGAGYIDYDL